MLASLVSLVSFDCGFYSVSVTMSKSRSNSILALGKILLKHRCLILARGQPSLKLGDIIAIYNLVLLCGMAYLSQP